MWWSCCSLEVCSQKEQNTPSAPSPMGVASTASSPEKPQATRLQDGGGTTSAATPEPAPSAPAAAAAPPVANSGPPRPEPLTLPKGRSRELDSCDAASVASSQKHSTRSGYSNASSVGSEFMNNKISGYQGEVAKIQSQMKSFVKGMLKGREMSVLSIDGQLRSCTCSFDRKLRNYNICISKDTRQIEISTIQEVFQGLEPDDIQTPLDELCCTFVVETGECVTFRFKDVEERQNFAICLSIIVDG